MPQLVGWFPFYFSVTQDHYSGVCEWCGKPIHAEEKQGWVARQNSRCSHCGCTVALAAALEIHYQPGEVVGAVEGYHLPDGRTLCRVELLRVLESISPAHCSRCRRLAPVSYSPHAFDYEDIVYPLDGEAGGDWSFNWRHAVIVPGRAVRSEYGGFPYLKRGAPLAWLADPAAPVAEAVVEYWAPYCDDCLQAEKAAFDEVCLNVTVAASQKRVAAEELFWQAVQEELTQDSRWFGKDYQQALVLYEIAGNMGHPQAGSRLDALHARLRR